MKAFAATEHLPTPTAARATLAGIALAIAILFWMQTIMPVEAHADEAAEPGIVYVQHRFAGASETEQRAYATLSADGRAYTARINASGGAVDVKGKWVASAGGADITEECTYDEQFGLVYIPKKYLYTPVHIAVDLDGSQSTSPFEVNVSVVAGDEQGQTTSTRIATTAESTSLSVAVSGSIKAVVQDSRVLDPTEYSVADGTLTIEGRTALTGSFTVYLEGFEPEVTQRNPIKEFLDTAIKRSLRSAPMDSAPSLLSVAGGSSFSGAGWIYSTNPGGGPWDYTDYVLKWWGGTFYLNCIQHGVLRMPEALAGGGTKGFTATYEGSSVVSTYDTTDSTTVYHHTVYRDNYYVYVNAGEWQDVAGNWSEDRDVVTSTTPRYGGISVQKVSSNTSISGSLRTQPYVSYSAHVSDIGWQSTVYESRIAGTVGKNLNMEAMKLSLTSQASAVGGSVQYRAHVTNVGWQGWVSNGAVAGTTGKSQAVEAFQAKLTGALAQQFDLYYRAHVAGVGWQGWVANGATAGTTGQALSVQAFEVKLVPKDAGAYSYDGAVYTAYSDSACTKVAQNVTTGTIGYGEGDMKLTPGTYWVKETRAPKGFNLDTGVYKVSVTADQRTRVNNGNVYEPPKTVAVRFYVDGDTTPINIDADRPLGSSYTLNNPGLIKATLLAEKPNCTPGLNAWYTDKALTKKYSGSTLTADLNLYARNVATLTYAVSPASKLTANLEVSATMSDDAPTLDLYRDILPTAREANWGSTVSLVEPKYSKLYHFDGERWRTLRRSDTGWHDNPAATGSPKTTQKIQQDTTVYTDWAISTYDGIVMW